MERLVKLEVLGQEYPFYTDAPEADVEEILQLVKSQLEANSEHMQRLPSSKVAILACLNVASRYVKMKRDLETLRNTVHEDMERVAKRIESSLNIR